MGASSSSLLKQKARLAEAIEHGDVATASSMITSNPRLVRQEPEDPWALLHIACWSNQPKVVELLLLAGADANAVNKNTKETPLHYASKAGNAQVVGALIQAGADVNARNKLGYTPLHFAVDGNFAAVVRILRQYGADASQLNAEGVGAAQLSASAEVTEALSSVRHPVTPRAAATPGSSALIAAPSNPLAIFTFIKSDELKLAEALGSGATGKVFRGIWRGTTPVAVKQFYPTAEHDFEAEVRGISSIGNHPNLVTTYGVVIGTSETPFMIVTELVEHGSLSDLFHKKKLPLSDTEIAKVSLGIAAGALFLHSKNIIHRDIKSQNVLIADPSTLSVKLCDFGLARAIDATKPMTSVVGTPQYMAPECIAGTRYDAAADVYSFGMTLYELPGKIVEGYRPKMPSDEHHPALLRLVVGCWDAKPATRPTFADIARILRETFPTL